MLQRLSLKREVDSDPDYLIRPLLRLLEAHELDFHSTFRTLTSFQPSFASAELELLAARLIPELVITSRDARERAQKEWVDWLEKFKKRIEEEREDWSEHENWTLARKEEGRKANPRFVLRQWVLEEVIEKVEKDHIGGKRILAKVLEVCETFVLCAGCPCSQLFHRWRPILSDLGEPKMTPAWRGGWIRKSWRNRDTVGWDRRNSLGSNAVARVEMMLRTP